MTIQIKRNKQPTNQQWVPTMRNYNDETLLELVELYASEACLNITNEDDLSNQFDNEVLPILIENYSTKGEEFQDTAMINEAFNNWSDMLCKDGEIHPEQYDNYCYVGSHS